MHKTIRFGIMGAGSIAHKFARAIPLVENAELIACASRTPGRAAAFAAEFGIPTAYDNYEELLANPDIDCVYIGTTPNFHFDNLMDCIAAGKHILCEKPILTCSSDVQYVMDAQRKTGKFLMEAMWARFLPAHHTLREIIRSGELGALRHIETRHGFYGTPENSPRLHTHSLEASAWTDLGIYNYDITTFYTGTKPENIVTSPGILYDNIDIEDNVIMHFPGDVTAYMLCSFRYALSSDMTIYCENAKITVGPYFLNPEVIKIEMRDGETRELRFDFPNGFEFEIAETVRCINEGLQESPTHPWADMLEYAEVNDKLFAAWGNPWQPHAK